MLRVAFFGAGGAVSTRALATLAERHRIVCVVESAGHRIGALGTLRAAVQRWRRGARGLLRSAAELRVPYVPCRDRADARVIRQLSDLQPDLICIAGFRWVVPASVFGIPAFGALNLHTSLLPRHRGLMPLLWVYREDDRETGCTVHWVSDRADAGDILVQDGFPLERGRAIGAVHAECAERGARLLAQAVDAVELRTAPRIPQDESRATAAPRVRPGEPFVDFAGWDVERVWHCLAGLLPLFCEPLTDAAGRAVRYDGVAGFERRQHTEAPGCVAREGSRCVLHCRGGVVHLHAGIGADG